MSKVEAPKVTPNGLATSGSLLKFVESNACKVGMRVQDTNGNMGTVKWVGKLDKTPPPPPTPFGQAPKNVTYAGVVFDEPKIHSPWRFDGTLHGVKLIDGAAPGTVAFLQPKKELFEEIIPKCVEEMRRRFGDAIKSWHDVEITKFLIARKFDLKLASEMLENHLKWEKEHVTAGTLKEYFPERMAQQYPVGLQPNHYDYEGNLIRVERPTNGGKVLAKDFVAEFGLPTIMRWHIASVEACKERMRAEGWKTQRVCFIIDLKGLDGLTGDVSKFGQMEGKIDQDHYPEMMARAFIINAPWYFTGIWKIIKLFVDDRTKDKFQILGDDYRKELLKYLPEDAIPSFAGGKNDGWLDSTNGGRVGALNPPMTAEEKAAAAARIAAEEKEAAQLHKFLEENAEAMAAKEAEEEKRREEEEKRALESRDVSQANEGSGSQENVMSSREASPVVDVSSSNNNNNDNDEENAGAATASSKDQSPVPQQ